MNGDDISWSFEGLREKGAKYMSEGYEVGELSDDVYHDPINPEQEEIAQRISKRYKNRSYAAYMCSIIFVIFFIWSIVMKDRNIIVIISLAIACVICGVAISEFRKNLSKEVQVMTGKAILKEEKRIKEDIGYRHKYYVTIIPDNGEKVIYKLIRISKADYEKVVEGTPIIVVNRGPYACVLTHNT